MKVIYGAKMIRFGPRRKPRLAESLARWITDSSPDFGTKLGKNLRRFNHRILGKPGALAG
jgi:hypothetical protein